MYYAVHSSRYLTRIRSFAADRFPVPALIADSGHACPFSFPKSSAPCRKASGLRLCSRIPCQGFCAFAVSGGRYKRFSTCSIYKAETAAHKNIPPYPGKTSALCNGAINVFTDVQRGRCRWGRSFPGAAISGFKSSGAESAPTLGDCFSFTGSVSGI